MKWRFRTDVSPDSGIPLVAVDLGYSSRSPSCGVMHDGLRRPRALKFGACIEAVGEELRQRRGGILVVEAVLSTFHSEDGNPDARGEFERGMGWYYGPGAVTVLAATRFLSELYRKISGKEIVVYLAEAFVSFKARGRSHTDDAELIYRRFREAPVQPLRDGCQPIVPFIEGVPPVFSFVRWCGQCHENRKRPR